MLFNGSLASHLCDEMFREEMRLKSIVPGGHPVYSRQIAPTKLERKTFHCIQYTIADNKLHMVSHRFETVVMQTLRYNVEYVVTNVRFIDAISIRDIYAKCTM